MTRETYVERKEILEKALEFLKKNYISQMPSPKFKSEIENIDYRPGIGNEQWEDIYHGKIIRPLDDCDSRGYRLYRFMSWDFGGDHWDDNIRDIPEDKLYEN